MVVLQYIILNIGQDVCNILGLAGGTCVLYTLILCRITRRAKILLQEVKDSSV